MINSQVERASHESAQVGIGERLAHLLLCGQAIAPRTMHPGLSGFLHLLLCPAGEYIRAMIMMGVNSLLAE